MESEDSGERSWPNCSTRTRSTSAIAGPAGSRGPRAPADGPDGSGMRPQERGAPLPCVGRGLVAERRPHEVPRSGQSISAVRSNGVGPSPHGTRIPRAKLQYLAVAPSNRRPHPGAAPRVDVVRPRRQGVRGAEVVNEARAHHDHPVTALLDKRRGFCPSCGARRMVESAAHLVDHVLPEQPIRQWVLTFPYPVRFLFAAQPRVLSQVLGVVYRAISTYLIKETRFTAASGAKTGAVTLIQRFVAKKSLLKPLARNPASLD